MNTKFLVVHLSPYEKRVVQLKASLAGQSVDEFALETLGNAIPKHGRYGLCSCGNKMKNTKSTLDYVVDVAGKERKIKVLNFPLHECKICGVEKVNKTFDYFEKAFEFKVNDWMRDISKIPEIVDFDDLLTF